MPQLIVNTYVSSMYKLNENGKVFTNKFVGTGPSSYKKRIYRAAVSQTLRNTALWGPSYCKSHPDSLQTTLANIIIKFTTKK